MRLTSVYCPKASKEEKAQVQCKVFAITKKIKTTTDTEEIKRLQAQRAALIAAQSHASAEAQRNATRKAKEFYT